MREKISKDVKIPKTNSKMISAEFSFGIIGVWGYHMKSGGDNWDWKFVSTSSKGSIFGHYKDNILAYDMLYVHKLR